MDFEGTDIFWMCFLHFYTYSVEGFRLMLSSFEQHSNVKNLLILLLLKTQSEKKNRDMDTIKDPGLGLDFDLNFSCSITNRFICVNVNSIPQLKNVANLKLRPPLHAENLWDLSRKSIGWCPLRKESTRLQFAIFDKYVESRQFGIGVTVIKEPESEYEISLVKSERQF